MVQEQFIVAVASSAAKNSMLWPAFDHQRPVAHDSALHVSAYNFDIFAYIDFLYTDCVNTCDIVLKVIRWHNIVQ